MLPEAAPLPELFDFASEYLEELDARGNAEVANYPVFFALQCIRFLGYDLGGQFTEETPYLNLVEGGFTAEAPFAGTRVTLEDSAALARLMAVQSFSEIGAVEMNGGMRQRLLEWFLEFLKRHTEHMKPVKSLAVLQAVLR